MKINLVAAVAALSLFTLAAQAEGEGNGDPFPFRAPASTFVANGSGPADTGSAAYPDLTGRPAQVVTAGGVAGVPMTGSESPVQTANSLPRGFVDGTVAYAQAQSERRWFADQGAHAVVSAQRSSRSHS